MLKEKMPFYELYGLRIDGTTLTWLDGSLLSKNENHDGNHKRMDMFSKLAFRSQFGSSGKGRVPRRHKKTKQAILNLLMRRYSDCFEFLEKGYKFDHECFIKKQNKYLQYILRLKFKYIF